VREFSFHRSGSRSSSRWAHLERAVLRDGLLDTLLHRATIGAVGLDAGRGVAAIADLVRHRLAGLGTPRRDHDVGALARERERDPATDALTRAGDDRGATVEATRASGRRHGAITALTVPSRRRRRRTA
jgi:hypothetical protein